MSARSLNSQLYRVIDANLNRSKEGLRVCEDYCRFLKDNADFTRKIKRMRHDITSAVGSLDQQKLLKARGIEEDVGRGTTATELKRRSYEDIFGANAQRVKESIRVLEEFSKLIDPVISLKLKKIRYRFYALERDMAAGAEKNEK